MSVRACIRKHKGVNFDALMATAAAYSEGTEQARLQRAADEIIAHFRNERTDILAQIYKQAKKPLPKETDNAPEAPEAVESQPAETTQETAAAAAPLPNPIAALIPASLSDENPQEVIDVLTSVRDSAKTPIPVSEEADRLLGYIREANEESYADEVTDARVWLTDTVAKHQTKKGPVRTVVSAPAGTPTTKQAKQAKPLGMAAQLGVKPEDANAPAVEEAPVVQPTLTAPAVTQILTPEQKKAVKDYYGGKQAAAIESLTKDYVQWKTDPLTFSKHPMRSVLESIRKKASTQFSKTVPNTPEERTTVSKIRAALRSWFITPETAASRLVVVQKWEDLSQTIRDRGAEAQKSVATLEGMTQASFAHLLASVTGTQETVKQVMDMPAVPTKLREDMLREAVKKRYAEMTREEQEQMVLDLTAPQKDATRIQAFVLDGKGYMVADNISEGNELAVFMHEIGAHIGLDGQEAQIMERVNLWRSAPEGSVEKQVFDAMQARMEAAGEVSDSEKVAYAVEEAVKSGVTPRAVKMGMKLSDVKSAQDLVSWFAQYFKAAVDALFKANTRGFNAQQLVDLAYGAARDAMANQEIGADVTAMSSKDGVSTKAAYTEQRVDSLLDTYGYNDGRVKAGVVWMSPQAFLDATTSREEQARLRERKSKGLSQSVPMSLRVDSDGRIVDHEGRHRMAEFVDAGGVDKVPVVIYRSSASNDLFPTTLLPQKNNGNTGSKPVLIAQPLGITYENKQALVDKFGPREGRPVQFSIASELKPQVAKYLGPTGIQFWDGAARFVRNVMLETISLPDLIHRYEERVPGLRKLYDAMLASQNRKIELDQEVDTLMQQIEGAKLSKAQVKTINQFLMDSTTEQKWAYDPKFKRKTTIDPEFEKRFNSKDFTPEMREIVKQVFQHGETTMERKREVFKLIGVADPFKRLTQLQGPYAPLRRFGEYMVEVKSLDLVAEEAKQEDGTGGFKDTKKIDELRSDPDHYRISFRTTEAEAKRLYNELLATGKYARSQNLSYVGPRVERAYTSSDINRSSLAKVLESVKGDESLDRDTRNKMENTVKDLYHQMMEDHLARQSMRQRKYRAGADENMLESFFKQARSESAFLANMEHAQKVNEATYQVSKNSETHAKEQRLQDVVNTMMKHRKLMLDFKDTPWQDAAVGFTSAMQLATSPGYHFANATQPAMKTIPMLAAEFNDYGGAWTHLNTGYKIYAQAMKDKFDFAKVKSPGLRKMLETASKMNLIDVGMGEDYDQYNSPRTGFEKVDTGLNNGRKVIHKLRQVSRGVERANRISASVAAYNMAIEKGRTHDQAQAFAIQVLGQTQGDFSQLAAPLIIKKLPKFITQYRKYQLMVAALYVRSFYDSFSGSSPAEKAIARRMLGYMLAHTAMVGGVMGLPLMNLAEFVIPALFGDDDEPKDLERMMREWFGSDIPADIILKGLPSMLGLDLGSKLSDDRVFSILPYTTLEMSKKGAAEALVGLMGPGMGLARKMIDGVDLMQNGEIGQGMEKLLPKGLEDAHKGYRLANKGVVLRNGDVLVTPEDINAFTIVMQGMGMPTSELKRYQWIQSQQIEITKFYTARESEIKKDYIEAQRAGEDTTDLKDQWRSLQDRKGNMRVYFGNQVDELKSKPLSTLMDAPKKQREREAKRQETMVEQ